MLLLSTIGKMEILLATSSVARTTHIVVGPEGFEPSNIVGSGP